MTPGEVAKMFRVDPKTVTRWGKAGKLRSVRTPGGHRRYITADVIRMLDFESDVKPAPRCHKCGRTNGEIVPIEGGARFMHAYGRCP